MRIGLIAPPWLPVPPPAYGGIEAAIDTLALALQTEGHEVLLAASGDSTCPVERLPGFAESNADAIGASLQELSHIIRAYDALGDVDVIHDHTLAGPLYCKRPQRTPVVTTVHGPFLPAMLQLYRAVPDDVSIVAISYHQASTADGVRIARVVHHGIRLGDIAVGDGSGGYACFLGRMHPNKGVLEAVRIAKRAGIPLRIAAKMREQVEYAYFDSFIRPSLGADVEYVGELAAADKYSLLGSAVALVNPLQWEEPFGLVMIEALATGTPVIATPRGSAAEIVDHGRTGYLGDGDELAQALVRAADLDRGLCRAAAEQRFSAERMAAEHLELYRERLA